MDMQRSTYCEAAMGIMETYNLSSLARVVDCAIGLWDLEADTCRSFDWIMDYINDPTNLPLHADRHAGAGADPILSLGAHDITGDAELQNGVDLVCAVAFGSDVASIATPLGTVNAGGLEMRQDTGYCIARLTANAAAGQYPYLGLRRSRGTYGSEGAVTANKVLGAVAFYGHDGTAYRGGANFYAQAAENFDATHRGTKVTFQCVDNGDTALSDYMVINGDGETVDMVKKLDVQGGLAAGGADGWSGSFTNGDGDTVTVTNGIITDVS